MTGAAVAPGLVILLRHVADDAYRPDRRHRDRGLSRMTSRRRATLGVHSRRVLRERGVVANETVASWLVVLRMARCARLLDRARNCRCMALEALELLVARVRERQGAQDRLATGEDHGNRHAERRRLVALGDVDLTGALRGPALMARRAGAGRSSGRGVPRCGRWSASAEPDATHSQQHDREQGRGPGAWRHRRLPEGTTPGRPDQLFGRSR